MAAFSVSAQGIAEVSLCGICASGREGRLVIDKMLEAVAALQAKAEAMRAADPTALYPARRFG
jgi:hypothetical protein